MKGQAFDIDSDPAPLRVLEERHPPGRGRAHAHRKHQLLLTRRGVLEFEGGGTTALLTSGVAAWVPAGMTHAAHARSDAVLLAMYVSDDWLEARDSTDTDEKLQNIPPSFFSVPPWWSGMLGHLQSLDADAQRHLGAPWLEQLAQWAQESWPLQLALPQDAQLRQACQLLKDERPLTEIAKAVGVSARTLARRAQRELGEGLSQWATRRRLLNAAMVLQTTDRPLAQIAFDAGFRSQSAFSYAFRRHLGESPGRFRQRTRIDAR